MSKDIKQSPIAVIGVSALFPGSHGTDGFWRDILAGKDLISDTPPTHWLIEDYYDPDPKAMDKTYAKRGGFIDPIDFDAMGWGIPPSIIPATDTAQLLALIVAERVLEDASKSCEVDRNHTSVILGVTSAQELLGAMVSRLQKPIWQKSLRDMGLPESQVQEACKRIASHYTPWQEATFPGLLGNVVAGRIANRLNLGGTNCVTDAACASTFSALSMGINELRLGQSDLVIAGGVDTMNDIFMYMCFSKTPAMSPTGDCRPFSDAADGTLLGEGIGMFALKRLEDAEESNDRIYGVIRGLGSSSDGRAKSVYAPLAEGQAKALTRAYDQAGYDPRTVELIEAHGTGTKAGDAAEFNGLKMVFSDASEDKQWCALGSVKSQVGHTKSAAGAAGLFKVLMALNESVLPPTIKIDRPNPKLEIDQSPFYLNTEARPWIRDSKHLRRGSISSFGFGGSNFHVAVEAPSTPVKRLNTCPVELFCFDGDQTSDVVSQITKLQEELSKERFIFLARNTHKKYSGRKFRALFVAKDVEQLSSQLQKAQKVLSQGFPNKHKDPTGYYLGQQNDQKVAFLFPGQGSQYVAMGAELAIRFHSARKVWDQAADVDIQSSDALHHIVFPTPVFTAEDKADQETTLRATDWAQPALGVSSMATAALLKQAGLKPDYVAGHSFGELTALWACEAIGTETLIRLARRRGQLMAQAAANAPTEGSMTAVSATLDKIQQVLGSDFPSIQLANHNAPEQIVIAGPVEALSKAEAKLKDNSLRFKRLNVATAFHSKLVEAAQKPFLESLEQEQINQPQIPVYANTSAERHADAPETIRQVLASQLASPVRFVDMIQKMYDDGARVFVEVGAGSVLTGLVDRILAGKDVVAISTDKKGQPGFTQFLKATAELMSLGLTLDPVALFSEYQEPVDPATLKKPKMAVSLCGSNFGKPYPPEDGAAGLPKPNPEIEAPKPPPAVAVMAAKPVVQTKEEIKPQTKIQPAAKPQALTSPIQKPQPKPQSITPKPTETSSLVLSQLSQKDMSKNHKSNGQNGHSNGIRRDQNGHSATNGHSANGHGAPQKSISPSYSPTSQWYQAWQTAQHEAASTHAVFQKAMAEAHTAYLRLAEASLNALTQTNIYQQPTEQSWTTSNYPDFKAIEPAQPARQAITAAVAAPNIQPQQQAVAKPVPAPAPTPVVSNPVVSNPVVSNPVVSNPVVSNPVISQPVVSTAAATPAPVKLPETKLVAAPAPQAQPAQTSSALSSDELENKLKSVVADATGYPIEMLETSMNLEADLGIDSIKRVEILSLVKKQVPELPEMDAATLGSLETLGEVAQHLTSALGTSQTVPSKPAPVSVVAPAASAPGLSSDALREKLKTVVADATGYPSEMLEPSMNLEADLGIDSIKRVEILSIVKKQVPELPEMDAATLGSLETLGDVANHLIEALGTVAGPVSTSTEPTAVTSTSTASIISDEALHEKLKDVVAEATGYPSDMLEPNMNLEADLGIDSIKRVEILSIVKKQVPELPEMDAATLGSLNTLGEVAGYLIGSLKEASPAVSVPTAANVIDSAKLEGILKEVVAEATGYPSDMLEREMNLEADLGIDSIKRVEILSLVKKAVPSLPELDAATLGSLNTLGEVSDHLLNAAGQESVATATAQPQQTESPSNTQATTEYRYLPQLVPAPAAGLTRLQPNVLSSVGVIGGPDAIADQVTLSLQQLGFQATRRLEPSENDDGLVMLYGLELVSTQAEALALVETAFKTVRTSKNIFEAPEALLCTVQDTGGGLGIQPPLTDERTPFAALAALSKTVSIEAPNAKTIAIDVATDGLNPEDIANKITQEIMFGGLQKEVALRGDNSRWTIDAVATAFNPQDGVPVSLQDGDVIVATGGARGVTAHCLKQLAQKVKAKFILLGRTAISAEPQEVQAASTEAEIKRALLQASQQRGEKVTPAEIGKACSRILANREVLGTIQSIQSTGAHAEYISVDVTNASALSDALSHIRSNVGPIKALVHAAGVIKDKRILDKTDEQFDLVLKTKVSSLQTLLEATQQDDLKTIVFFSSVAGFSGNTGQSDYAMANAILDAVAVREGEKRGTSCLVKSLAWGPWRGGMVSAQLEARFEAAGVPLIHLDDGARWFCDELSIINTPRVLLGGAPSAESLLPGDEAQTDKLGIYIHASQYAELVDHAVEGPPVVPVVWALEWMSKALMSRLPSSANICLENVRVRRGIVLEGWPQQITTLFVTIQQQAHQVFKLAIVDANGQERYVATGRNLENMPAAVAQPTGIGAASNPRPYGGVLFHGPQFQAIDELQSRGAQGAIAKLSGSKRLGWNKSNLVTDPGCVDGLFQLAVLATEDAIKGASLPTRIERVCIRITHNLADGYNAWSTTQEHHQDQLVSHLVAVDAQGTPSFVIEGLETTRRPGWKGQ